MTAGNVTLSADLSGYYAPAAAAHAPGIIVLMEAFGLTPHIERVCQHLAGAGFAALAPDFYHGKTFVYDDLPGAMAQAKSLDDERVLQEICEGIGFLARQPDVDRRRIGLTGFCLGGRLAFHAAARLGSRITAAAAFYGGGIAPAGTEDRFGRRPPIHDAGGLRAPLLLVYGGQDGAIDGAERGRVAQRLGELGKHFTLSLYPDAGHGFCCEDRPSYHAESARAANAEMIDFFRRALM